MKARIAVATTLSSAISSSEVRALNGYLITTLILCAFSAETDGNRTIELRARLNVGCGMLLELLFAVHLSSATSLIADMTTPVAV